MKRGCLAVVAALITSSAFASCPKGSSPDPVVPTVCKEGAETDSSHWVSNENAPGKGHQPDWETGVVKAMMPPAQTWDAHTGGTEIADQLRWKKEHAVPVADASAGKPAGFTK